jgi:hypothetical protein
MSSLSLFLEMVNKLREFLQQRSNRLAAEKELVEATLSAVNHAANHTRGYLADLRDNPSNRRREKEIELSDAWVEVGKSLLRINDPAAQKLYDRCFMKAKYWSDPDGYDLSGNDNIDIRLETVLKDVEAICLKGNNT